MTAPVDNKTDVQNSPESPWQKVKDGIPALVNDGITVLGSAIEYVGDTFANSPDQPKVFMGKTWFPPMDSFTNYVNRSFKRFDQAKALASSPIAPVVRTVVQQADDLIDGITSWFQNLSGEKPEKNEEPSKPSEKITAKDVAEFLRKEEKAFDQASND